MLLNISHSLLGVTHFIRTGSLSLLVPYRSSLSAFKATSGNLYATHQGLYRQPLVCNASRSRGARKGETSTTWEMKPTWDLPRGGTFNSWGRGRKGESGSSSFLHSRKRAFLQERCQGSKGGMGWYYPSPHLSTRAGQLNGGTALLLPGWGSH